MSNTVECHYCGLQKDKNFLQGFIARCCMKRCNKYYCISCIHAHFNPEFQQNNYKKDTWICYFCQDTCNCLKCKHQELNQMERKNKRRSKNSALKINQESADLQSHSNVSLCNNINALNAANSSIIIPNLNSQISNLNSKVVDKSNQFLEKPSREEEEDNQKNLILPISIHQQMMIPADDVLLLPPYLKKIAQRKNFYFDFMSKQSKAKTEDKQNRKLKQLINSELSRRKGDTDGIDLEIE